MKTYKRLLIFGCKDSGKTSLKIGLQKGVFQEIDSSAKPYEEETLGQGTNFQVSRDNSNAMELSVIESTIEEDLDEEKIDFVETCCYCCQCAVVLIDSSGEDSLPIIENFLDKIKKPSYLSIIFLVNERKDAQINSEAIQGISKKYNATSFSVNLIKGDNFSELKEEIYNKLYENIPNLNINMFVKLPKTKKSSIFIRIVVIGDSQAGKSSFVERCFSNTFHDQYLSTIGVTDQLRSFKVNEKIVNILIWDTAGQERFRALPKNMFTNADGILIIYDVKNRNSFKNVENWISQVDNFVGRKNRVVYLVGNKIDLPDRTVTKKEGEDLAKEKEIKYNESSAKLNINTQEIFFDVAFDCINKSTKFRKEFLKKGSSKKKNFC